MLLRDNYTDFYFDNLNSANFKVWITNSHDLQMNISPSFSDKFVSPVYGQMRYYEGTTIESQDFKLKCAAINITKQEWRAISEWLSPLKIAPLSFLWNKQHYFMVKVNSAPSGVIWVNNKVDNIFNETYNVTFEISFTTVSDWAALGGMSTMEYSIIDDDGAILFEAFDNLMTCERFKNSYHIPFSFINSGKHFLFDESKVLYNNLGWITIDEEQIKTNYTSSAISLFAIYFLDTQDGYYVQYNDNNFEFYKSNKSENEYKLSSLPNFYCGSNAYIYFYSDAAEYFTYNQENFSLRLCNPGSYNLYPNILSNASNFKLINHGEDLFYYTAINEGPLPNYVVYQSRQGTASYSGSLLPTAVDENGISQFYNIGFKTENYFLESGRPEILKVKYITEKNVDITLRSVDSSTIIKDTDNFKKAIFKITKKFSYDRSKDYIISIFKDWPYTSNTYNISNFNSGSYQEGEFTALISICPNISFKQYDDGWYLEIIYTKNFPGSTISCNDFLSRGNYCYISICDVDTLEFNAEPDSHLLLDMQTRDVL